MGQHALASEQHPARMQLLVVQGRLDAAAAAQLSASICASGRRRVAVDLGRVVVIDPGALRDVLLASRIAGIELHVACPKAAPGRRAFALARVSAPVNLHESLAEALLAVGG